MPSCETLIRNVRVLDGSGAEAQTADVAVDAGVVCAIGQLSQYRPGRSRRETDGYFLPVLSMSTRMTTRVIRDPQMLAKLSQGVTTVIVGNCGISAAPVQLSGPASGPYESAG